MNHPLHQKVAKNLEVALRGVPGCRLICDQACGGSHQLPLFLGAIKGQVNEICDVDLLVLQEGRLKVLVEIDETNVKPTQICGKFLTSALASHFIHRSHNNEPIEKSESVLFLQVVDISKLSQNSVKKAQLAQIQNAIQQILPLGCISRYEIFRGDEAGIHQAVDCASNFCSLRQPQKEPAHTS